MELLIPSTFGTNERDEKLLVQRISNLARAIAIFGVDHVTIYKDEDPKADEERNAELIEKYLGYAECPPYLRKQLIPRDPDLEYASILTPLQILSHGYSDEFREGAVMDVENGESVINAGLDDPVTLPYELEEDARVTLMQQDGDWTPIDYRDLDTFWTFTVQNLRQPLGEILDERSVPVIGTSVKGEGISAFQQADHSDREDAVIVFGSAWRGIYELCDRGDCEEDQFDGIYNFVPHQHTETVRTSEAVPIVLGIINALHHEL